MKRWFALYLAHALALPAMASERIPSHCIAIASEIEGARYLHQVSWRAPVEADTVRITYIDHATFLIQTEGGLAVATDYTGWLGGADIVPDAVTMNIAHETHHTLFPDERIPHVLKGWTEAGVARHHHLDLGEMLIRNVPTDIRALDGERVMKDGNSIFVFEAAGLCIGHLGHLHHEPDAGQYARIGRLDVVLAAVDGGITLDHATMLKVMARLKARVVIPMHWFGRSALERFLNGMEMEGFTVIREGDREIVLSLEALPVRPTVVVLEPGPLD
jgi:L-ascorbate metabolism protein UlaG (beta-lactamase superfamily)